MTLRFVIVVGVCAGVGVGDLQADPAPARPAVDLTLRRRPGPRHLRMRTAQTGAPAPTPAPAPAQTPTPTPSPDAEAIEGGDLAVTTPRATDLDLAGVRHADEQVLFRIDLGFAVDGGARSGRRALAGEALSTADYRQVRAVGFGNVFAGTRGLLIPPLSSYLSLGFRLAPALESVAPLADALDSTEDVQVRSGWAEAAGFLPGRILRSLRVRAGRQYAYGPWPIHFDGGVVAWTGRALRVSALVGVRVDEYAAQGEPGSFPPVVALIGSLDLGALGRAPITLRGTLMQLDDRRFGDLELGYRPRRGLVVVAGARAIGGRLARERAQARVQVSEVTHIVADFEHRHATDWRWDPAYVDPGEPGAARPYLELQPTERQARGSIRAGTVLLDNIDLYGRAAAAVDLEQRPDETTGYVELGAAAEVRVRRQIAVSASAMIRDYELTDPAVLGTFQVDRGNEAQPLLDPTDPFEASSMGTESFIEAGGGIKFTTGARRFTASGEGYYRRAKYSLLYREDTEEVGDLLDRFDSRGGLRFILDGWMTSRVRFHLEYDLSTSLDHAPEINGWKQMRVMLEGNF